MKVWLYVHYSDTWADQANQTISVEWRNWLTRCSQTPVGNRAGSTPASGTNL